MNRKTREVFKLIGRSKQVGQEARIIKAIKRRLPLREDFLGFLPRA